MNRAIPAIFFIALLAVFTAGSSAWASTKTKARPPARATQRAAVEDGLAEAQLIAIYRLIGQARTREALHQAEQLVQAHPHFLLAQLVLGDLLSAQTRPVRMLGDVPDTAATAAAPALAELREESQQRLRALRERPPAGAIPSQFLELSGKNRHAIAVDTSRSRLYLFENSAAGPRLVADYYISQGKSGTDKTAEGDLRTPLGVYFISSSLNPKSLKSFYGVGALPINYPNPYDLRRGRSGGGIWLHGTPPNLYARAPKSTDGCVVLANPDLAHIIQTVEVRTTPVVIAQQLQWVSPVSAQAERKGFEPALQAWRNAKSSGDVSAVLPYYSSDFNSYGKPLTDWLPNLRSDMAKLKGRSIELKELSVLQWKDNSKDSADTMVVTFGEVASGAQTGPVRRQYWLRLGGQWKIFFEGVIG